MNNKKVTLYYEINHYPYEIIQKMVIRIDYQQAAWFGV